MATESLTVELKSKSEKLDKSLKNTEDNLNDVDSAVKRVDKDLKNLSKTNMQVSKTAVAVNRGIGGVGRSAGMAGIQFQQFVGQIQGGQGVMLALSQQSADLGFVLGAPLLGAIAGVSASMIGILAPAFFKTSEAAKDFTFNVEEAAGAIDKLGTLSKAQVSLAIQNTSKSMDELSGAAGDSGKNIAALNQQLDKGEKTSIKITKTGRAVIEMVKLDDEERKKLNKELVQEQANLDKINQEFQKESDLLVKLTQNRKGLKDVDDKPEDPAADESADISSIENRFLTETELLSNKLDQELLLIGDNDLLKLQLEDEFLQNILDLDEKAEAEKLKILENGISKTAILKSKAAKAEIALEGSIAKNASQLAKQVLGDNKASALVGLAIQKASALSANAVSALAGSQLAFASQLIPGDPTSIGRAEAARDYTLGLGAINAGLIVATGLGQAAGIVSGGGSFSGGGNGGGGSESPQAQEDFSPETATQQVSFSDEDSTDLGGLTFNVEGGSSGDELVAVWLNDAKNSGRVRRGGKNDISN